MNKPSQKLMLSLLLLTASTQLLFSQNSVLVNLGSAACSSPTPGFFLIKDPLTISPTVMAGCDLSAQLPDYYNVYIAYNPNNNKIYLADIRTLVQTKIWMLDVGLPGSVTCPSTIPVNPNYTYDYVSNNFEFDNNGDLWSFSGYEISTGQCNIDKFDVNTGQVLNTRKLQFPDGHFPTAINSGDLAILPNGRMFATLGTFPSQLYEITNYNSTGPAIATFLQIIPQNCFGLAYLDGSLELTGFDPTGCYSFLYNISTNSLGMAKPFQNGQAPIDNTSFSPALGTTKQIISSSFINSNTANITYEIYVANMGNTILNNINVTDDLAASFSPAIVSNAEVTFADGGNPAGLILNPGYNGITNTELLSGDQQLANHNAGNSNYFFKLRVSCQVSNIVKDKIYYNSAIGKAIINNAVDPIHVSDSSNNGNAEMVDPDKDGNASGIKENIPTPFNLLVLPVKFMDVSVVAASKGNTLSWQVAAPVINASHFQPEFSYDGIHWTTFGIIPITDQNKTHYTLHHTIGGTGVLYYRVKQTGKDGQFNFSKVVIANSYTNSPVTVYPNPANGVVKIIVKGNFNLVSIRLLDATGRIVRSGKMNGGQQAIDTKNLPGGTYLLQAISNQNISSQKVVIRH